MLSERKSNEDNNLKFTGSILDCCIRCRDTCNYWHKRDAKRHIAMSAQATYYICYMSMCLFFSAISTSELREFQSSIRFPDYSLNKDIKKSVCQKCTQHTQRALTKTSRHVSRVSELQRTSFLFQKKYNHPAKHVSTWFISAVPSVFCTLGSARWMRQLFISQLQHLFCTYNPPAACSSVASRSIYSEASPSQHDTLQLDFLPGQPLFFGGFFFFFDWDCLMKGVLAQ